MNLIGDEWIPVLDGDGSAKQVGLHELYERAHEIRDLALQPPQRIAVTRLLLCITHAALAGPKDEEDWVACRDRIVSESLAYLTSRMDRFELFGDRPFMQVTGLEAIDNATLDKLDFGLSSGNNATLFDHEAISAGRDRSPDWIVLNLLTYQCFSPGGLIGETLWSGVKTGRTSTHAPCTEESPLHAILRAANLLGTIHLNLVPMSDLPVEVELGTPVWDTEIDGPESVAAKTFVATYLGRLVPLSRAVAVHSRHRCTLANGLAYPKLPIGRELATTVVLKGQGATERLGYLRIDLAKHPWREAPSVLAVKGAGDVCGPLALKHLVRNRDLGRFDVWLGGLAADRGLVLDAAEWNFSVPSALLEDRALAVYGAGVALAKEGEKSLRWAIKTYSDAMQATKSGAADGYRSQGVRTYWTALDGECHELVSMACSPETSNGRWGEIVWRAMRDGYSAACPNTTPRQILAFAQGQRRLFLKEEIDPHCEEKEEV